jgi:hypothetical protein
MLFRITVLMFAKQHGAYWCLLVACRQLRYSDVTVTVVRLWRGMWEEFGVTGKGICILLCVQKQFCLSKLQYRNFLSKLLWVDCRIISHTTRDCTRGSSFKCEIICVLLKPIEMVDVSTKHVESKQKYRVNCFFNILTKCILLMDKDYNIILPRQDFRKEAKFC